ncbi:cytochrome P450 [Pterulicium gracile]|uniref:Cytochrome P450 n=1 Tax=Pterulicium gracile TaxID=1884261 RepID=A0A5C3Q5F4_9AGAR|nr:cytochrome P450 [Pterula gracilis]
MSTFLVLVAAAIAFFLLRSWSKNRNLVFPPGPKPVPMLGNIFDVRAKELWLVAREWAQQFGDVTYLHIFGQGLVFLNTSKAAFDLMERKGSIYSDRPPLVMVTELCGCTDMVAFTRYGTGSRSQRKLMSKALSANAVKTYQPLIQMDTHHFVSSLIQTPKDYQKHIRRYAGGLTLNTIYGYRITTNNDLFLELAEECVDLLANEIASTGSMWMVDLFPFLKHIPEFMPGASFKRKAKVWKAKMEDFVEKPWDYFTTSLTNGTAPPSFCSTLIDADSLRPTDRESKEMKSDLQQKIFDLKWTANSMYSGSIDTTVTSIMHFILAMALHPEAQKMAQEEMDRVVLSEGRLPTFEDRERLPYLEALLWETLRWGCPVPLGLPHRLTEDDVYDGQFMAKGTLVFGNIWNILRDESIYPSADSFNPSRFMPSSLAALDESTRRKMDPRNYVFGFGRRVCPGSNLVDSSNWLMMAMMVATCQIGKPRDKEGRECEPKVEFNNSVFRTPDVFDCDIRPRSDKALHLLARAELELGA